jgi:hypothetical protein
MVLILIEIKINLRINNTHHRPPPPSQGDATKQKYGAIEMVALRCLRITGSQWLPLLASTISPSQLDYFHWKLFSRNDTSMNDFVSLLSNNRLLPFGLTLPCSSFFFIISIIITNSSTSNDYYLTRFEQMEIKMKMTGAH